MTKHIRTTTGSEYYLPASDALRNRLEEDAEAILSGPLKRRNAPAMTRMALTDALESLVVRELARAAKTKGASS